MPRTRLANRRPNETFAFDWLGMKFVATIAELHNGNLAEIFLSNGRVNSHADTAARDFAVVASSAPNMVCRPKRCGVHCSVTVKAVLPARWASRSIASPRRRANETALQAATDVHRCFARRA